MDSEVIRAFLKRQPFIPFRIEKTGGAWFEVTNPAIASVSRRAVELVLPIANGSQRFVTLALIHVVSVEIDLPIPSN